MTNPPVTGEAVERVARALEDAWLARGYGEGDQWNYLARAAIAAITKSPPSVSASITNDNAMREALDRAVREVGLKDWPAYPDVSHRVIRGIPNGRSDDPRIAVHQFVRDKGEPELITIGLYMGDGRWVEQEFAPESALALCGLILSKPAVAALSSDLSNMMGDK